MKKYLVCRNEVLEKTYFFDPIALVVDVLDLFRTNVLVKTF